MGRGCVYDLSRVVCRPVGLCQTYILIPLLQQRQLAFPNWWVNHSQGRIHTPRRRSNPSKTNYLIGSMSAWHFFNCLHARTNRLIRFWVPKVLYRSRDWNQGEKPCVLRSRLESRIPSTWRVGNARLVLRGGVGVGGVMLDARALRCWAVGCRCRMLSDAALAFVLDVAMCCSVVRWLHDLANPQPTT